MHILVFTIAFPYDGISHAGGEYLLRAARTMGTYSKVTMVALESEPNERALGTSARPSYDAIMLRYSGLASTWLGAMVRKVQRKLNPLWVPYGARRALRRNARLGEALRSADFVEFQWTEMAALRSKIFWHRSIPWSVVCHDVLAQKYARRVERASSLTRWLLALQLRVIRRSEQKLLRGNPSVVTFSEKDAALLRGIAPWTNPRAVFPPLTDPAMGRGRNHDGKVVTFVGAFSRPENIDAANWLLDEIWPRISAECPDAQLVLAGAGGDSLIASRSTADRNVEATGYLHSLNPVYQRTSVAIVPLRLGAGVKFKTVTAMLWGIPVVSTYCGIEGIADPSMFAGVSDEARTLAEVTVRVLREPASFAESVENAKRFAEERAGERRFAKELMEVHGVRAAK